MMQITRADNRGDLLIHQLTVPPASLNLQSGCQPYARTDHNQRPAGSPDIAATVDCLTDITTDQS